MKTKNLREPLENLGKTLKNVRSQKKLTLEQLSRMTGVSKAMLSQIEQGKVNPTVAVVIKVSQSLGVSVSELLNVEEKRNVIRIIHADDEVYTFRSDDLCKIRTLSPLELEKDIELYRIILEPNGQLISEGHFSGTEEVLYLSKGKLEVISSNQKVIINKGDSIHYRADVSHSIKNAGSGQVEAFMIVRYRE
jgi:transcriptional regulator with XRE-family HTH domain